MKTPKVININRDGQRFEPGSYVVQKDITAELYRLAADSRRTEKEAG